MGKAKTTLARSEWVILLRGGAWLLFEGETEAGEHSIAK